MFPKQKKNDDQKHTHPLRAVLGLTLLTGGQLHAQQDVTEYLEPTPVDRAWARTVLYKDDLNPLLQEFKLRGRYHGQYHHTESKHGEEGNWEDRRSRFGFDAKLFEKRLEARLDFQSDNTFEHPYDGLVDAYLKWKPDETLALTLGKTKPLIAYGDWIPSSNEAVTLERSQLFNQLGINRATGLNVEAEFRGLLWQAGVYANDTPATTGGSGAWGDGEFGHLNGGISYGLGVGRNFHHELDVEKALLRIDWIHSDREVGDVVLNRYDDILSLTFLFKTGHWTLTAEAFAASGGDGPNTDVLGCYVQPTYDLIPDKLQLVGRYSYAGSDGPAGLLAQGRYERGVGIAPIPGVAGSRNRGGDYHSFYLGAQYFIHGNKWKLLAGAEWSRLGRGTRAPAHETLTTFAGIRFSF